MKKIWRKLWFTERFYLFGIFVVVLYILAYFLDPFYYIAKLALVSFTGLVITDVIILFYFKKGITGQRKTPSKLSNGDINHIHISLQSFYPFKTGIHIIDELPFQFQIRNFDIKSSIDAQDVKDLSYTMRPTQRGNYKFGALNVFLNGLFGLAQRRFAFDIAAECPVYPSFLQMHKYELLAFSHNYMDIGAKKHRKPSVSQEFEQIKEYISGDDVRNLNWKASARKQKLMVNQYREEKAQQIFCVLDLGRTMYSPFNGLSLADYAINASLVLLNIALKKEDKAGLLTFGEKIMTAFPADRKSNQIKQIMESLYAQQSNFLESDFEPVYIHFRKNVSKRSLLVLFTNFEGLPSLERQMVYLQRLARHHILVVVLFENTEIKELVHQKASETEEIYVKITAQKLLNDKKLVKNELKRRGIYAVHCPPEQLTVAVLNQYLELKSRGIV